MRRCLESLEWQARHWERRAEIDTFEGERKEGAAAYAYQQAEVRRRIAARFEEEWATGKIASLRHFNPELESIFNMLPIHNAVEVEELQSSDESDEETNELEENQENSTLHQSEDADSCEEDEDQEEDADNCEEDEEDQEEEEDFGDDEEGTMDGDDEEDMDDEEELIEQQYLGPSIKDVLIAMEDD
ncbi:hypothetical protein VKT23_019243 [Stygiomarasmius scandens]|uniref:Uncharacterized protein n=1 Tax=Marasmiellus scandens TaxID=2682957 RepID=A0ABR1IPD8_9AGAR